MHYSTALSGHCGPQAAGAESAPISKYSSTEPPPGAVLHVTVSFQQARIDNVPTLHAQLSISALTWHHR